jgi:serine-type D-Ala-D-Ala carboxypeptidase (penicillin-binding protein 5/6)
MPRKKSPKPKTLKLSKNQNENITSKEAKKVVFRSSANLKIVVTVVLMLITTVGILLGLPQAVSLTQSAVAQSANIPNNKIAYAQLAPTPAPTPQVNIPKSKGYVAPPVTATAVEIVDLASGYVLYAKDANKRVPIASTTKVMTAMVGSEYFQPTSVLQVGSAATVDGSSMGLKLGEQITYRNVLYGLMLNSGNDAAYAISTNYPGGTAAFVAAMNQKAKDLGLNDTHFDNPAGFDSPNHYSSASDLAKIAAFAQKDQQFDRIIATKETEVASVDKTHVHPLKNLNKLLGEEGVLGMKTGTTPAAKESLITLVEQQGKRVIIVMLGSEDRFGETKGLIKWTYDNFMW